MGEAKKRRRSKRAWSDEELSILKEQWKNGGPVRMWVDMLPGRTEKAIISRGLQLELGRRQRQSGTSLSWRLICQVLDAGEALSSIEIARRAGISRSHADDELRRHYPAMLHIADYGPRMGSGYRPKLWKFGPGKDAAWPEPMSTHEIAARYWKRLKKDRPDILARRYAKQYLRNLEKAGKLIRRDEAAAWVVGSAA